MTGGPGWSGASGAPTRVLLARHGQTPLSVERRYSGQGDPELTALGRDQARRTAERIAAVDGLTAVVSSPQQRCIATGEHAAALAGVPFTTDPDFVETDFGDWEGLTFAQAARRDPELHAAWLGDVSVAPPGGESFAVVRTRVERGLRRLADEHPGETVALVSHVTPIKLALRHALDVGDQLLYRLHLDLASVSEIRLHPDGVGTAHLVNGTSHLEGL